MLIHDDNHFSKLQSVLECQNKTDGSIHFYCSDGKVEVKSTYLKLHSKLLSQIMPNVPFDWSKISSVPSKSSKNQTVILPDVPTSHINHLVSLITFGKVRFNVTKLSGIGSFSQVINEVLNTADLLSIKITNYGLNPEDNSVLQKPKKEYCELPDKKVPFPQKNPNGTLKPSAKGLEPGEIIDDETPVTGKRDKSMIKTAAVQARVQKRINYQDELKEFARYQEKVKNKQTDQQKNIEDKEDKTIGKRKAESSLQPNNSKKVKMKVRKCFICEYESRCLEYLTKHEFDHWNALFVRFPPEQPVNLVKCTLCGKTFPKILMEGHMLCFHRNKELSVPCPRCGDMFSKDDVFYNHMKGHINDKLKPTKRPEKPPTVDESITEVTPDLVQSSGSDKIRKVESSLASNAEPKPCKVIKSPAILIPLVSNPQVPEYSYRAPLTSDKKSVPACNINHKQRTSSKPKISVIKPSLLMNPSAMSSSSTKTSSIHNNNSSKVPAPVFGKPLEFFKTKTPK